MNKRHLGLENQELSIITNDLVIHRQVKTSDKYGLDCGLELNAKVFQLRLNNISGVLLLVSNSRVDKGSHCRLREDWREMM